MNEKSLIRIYIDQAATRGATKEELDTLFDAYFLERKYNLTDTQTPVSDEPKSIKRGTISVGLALFNTKEEAELALRQIQDRAKLLGILGVNDYHALCGANKAIRDLYDDYGWLSESLTDVTITPSLGKYQINIPQAYLIEVLEHQKYAPLMPSELYFDSHRDANKVASNITDILETYGTLSIDDLYILIGKDSKYGFRRLYHDFGWELPEILEFKIERNYPGWVLRYPVPHYICYKKEEIDQ